ncbi:MAG: ATP-binding protein [Candidatus Saccharimonadales bacterium]
MKSLSLSRPLVIMIIGLPGSGKSFFGRQFAEMFGAPIVSTDFIRHTLSPESAYDATVDRLVEALVANEITELMKTKKTFIVDGGMNTRSARFAVDRAAMTQAYGKLTVWVQTDEPTSLSRSLKRSSRRQDDAMNSSMDAESFERYKKQFSMPHRSENIAVISGKHTFTTQARIILKKLVAPAEEARAAEKAPNPHETKVEPRHDIQPRRHNVTIN